MSSYQPLARKYRPLSFADLVGQESTTLALTNGIKLGRAPRAVIFSGVRGVGKTTIARLYAKALNCEAGPTPTPCGTCESCQAIATNTHEDVLEIDGASHTGVDDVRILQENAAYVTQRSGFKVFVIDEVHMLSQSAFNALLKILEEPPPQVVFLMATTDLHRVPQTILSRAQVFHLNKIPVAVIEARLKNVLEREGITAEPKALAIVAQSGQGSLRDALTLLDQVIAVGAGSCTLAALSQIVHVSDTRPLLELLSAVIHKNAALVMDICHKLDVKGIPVEDVVEKLAEFCRAAFVVKDIGWKSLNSQGEHLEEFEKTALEQIIAAAGPFDLNRLFRSFMKCREDLDGSHLDQFVLENYLLEWCFDPGVMALSPKLHRLGDAFKEITKEPAAPKVAAPLAPPVQKPEIPAQPVAPVSLQAPPPPEPPAHGFPATWEELVQRWKKHFPLQGRKLEELHPVHYSAEKIHLIVPAQSFAARSFLEREEQLKLKNQFTQIFLFTGQLLLTPAAAADKTEPLPASLADQKAKAETERRQRIEEEVRSHPLTKGILEVMGGKIESIQVHDPSS